MSQAVAVKCSRIYGWDEDDCVEVVDSWDYSYAEFRVAVKFGKSYYADLEHCVPLKGRWQKVEPLESYGVIPHSRKHKKDMTWDEEQEASRFLERCKAHMLRAYTMPAIMDFKLERDYGWIGRDGVFYSGNFAQHSYLAKQIVMANFSKTDGSLAYPDGWLLEQGFMRVTAMTFNYECGRSLPPTRAQHDAMDALYLRFHTTYGWLDMRNASYEAIRGFGVADE